MSSFSVLSCLVPIINISNLFGILPCRVIWDRGIYRVVSEKRDLAYSIIFACILSVFFQLGIAELVKMESWKKLEFIAFLAAFAQIYGLFFVAIIAMLSGWLSRWRIASIIQRIDLVDRSLIALGIVYNYKDAKRKLIVQLIGLSLVPIGASMVNCFVINQRASIAFLCYFFICFMPIAVITLKEFQYYNTVLLIKKKLNLINDNLGEFSTVNPATETPIENSIQLHCTPLNASEEMNHRLKNLATNHAELMDILREVQTIFGPHLLASILIACGVITIQLYYLLTGIVLQLQYNVIMCFMTISWVAIQILLIMVNVVVCSKTSDTVRGNLKHQLKDKA